MNIGMNSIFSEFYLKYGCGGGGFCEQVIRVSFLTNVEFRDDDTFIYIYICIYNMELYLNFIYMVCK